MGALFMDDAQCYELRFSGLRSSSPDFAIPCDMAGSVDLDCLNDALRIRYLFARAVVGLEYRRPMVFPVAG